MPAVRGRTHRSMRTQARQLRPSCLLHLKASKSLKFRGWAESPCIYNLQAHSCRTVELKLLTWLSTTGICASSASCAAQHPTPLWCSSHPKQDFAHPLGTIILQALMPATFFTSSQASPGLANLPQLTVVRLPSGRARLTKKPRFFSKTSIVAPWTWTV